MKKFAEALVFAANCHSGQFRKDGRTPYINHPLEVMQLLAEAGETDEDVLSAAVLHDVIEDTSTTPEEIEERFGKRVCAIVLELTDDKRLKKHERKRIQLETAESISAEARRIRLCDKICNVRDIVHKAPRGWDQRRRLEYVEWAAGLAKRLRGCHAELENVLAKELEDALKELRG